MAGHTLSAYADEQTYQKVARLAKLEDRSTAQIVSAALRLYLRLPRHAHDALRRAEADGPESADAAAWAISKALIDRQYEAALAQCAAEATPLVSPDDDEEAILAKAVEITRRRPVA